MKNRKIIITVLVFIGTGILFAQDKHIGIQAGLNVCKVTGIDNTSGSATSSSVTMKLGPQVGCFFTFNFSDKLGFQPELLFSSKGYKYKWTYMILGNTNTTESIFSINYIEIPLQLRINVNDNIGLLAGPYVGILAGSKSKSKSTVNGNTTESSGSSTSGMESVDIGLNAGISYFAEAGFGFGFKLGYGFTNVFTSSTDPNKNLALQFIAAYRFN